MSTQEIEHFFHSKDIIPKEKVLLWMQSEDLNNLGAVYHLTDKAWERIKPELTMDEQCSFMKKYLLQCLELNQNSSDFVHSGFEAARELASWLKHLKSKDSTDEIIRIVVAELTSMYKRSDEETRNRIETGAIEHIFEDKRLLPYFLSWKNDPELSVAYKECLEWGKAHSNN